ncbi:MAG: CPBP family intramembrane metalloprotease [Clostridia bacterium]|nr:CPBP family intramembrane metalloprotease [Clostridia bacterium]
MSLVDGIVRPQYFIKSLIKIALFLLVPLVYFLLNRAERGELKKLFKPRCRELLLSLSLGLGIFAVILGGYFLLRSVIDFSGIADKLTGDVGVNRDNFVFVSLYISFVNSLLEEFFFRGFAFLTLKRNTTRKFAHSFSALAFSLYHAGMMIGWFGIGIVLLALAGLYVGGVIFNILNEKSENIYASWLSHMFANFAINTIGFILFGII